MMSKRSVRWLGLGSAILAVVGVLAGRAMADKAAAVKCPLGLKPVVVPEDNPMTPEKIELGKRLYFDTRLSKDGTVSCATCHDPKEGWAEHSATSTGIKGQVGGRNAPSVINAAYANQFWDGRAASLEEQALGPVQNPIEMGNTLPAMVAELSKDQDYRDRFQKVFGTAVTAAGVAKAIAAFERTIVSGNSPYDRFKAGDKQALNAAQKRRPDAVQAGRLCRLPQRADLQQLRLLLCRRGLRQGEARRRTRGRDEGPGRPGQVPRARPARGGQHGPLFPRRQRRDARRGGGPHGRGRERHSAPGGRIGRSPQGESLPGPGKDLVEFLKASSGEYPVIEPPQK